MEPTYQPLNGRSFPWWCSGRPVGASWKQIGCHSCQMLVMQQGNYFDGKVFIFGQQEFPNLFCPSTTCPWLAEWPPLHSVLGCTLLNQALQWSTLISKTNCEATVFSHKYKVCGRAQNKTITRTHHRPRHKTDMIFLMRNTPNWKNCTNWNKIKIALFL